MSKAKHQITLINLEGGSFLGILTLIFITLKLCGTITWSWWWVLAPLWMPIAFTFSILILAVASAIVIGIIVLLGLGIYWLIVYLIERRKDSRRRKGNLMR